MSSSKINPWVVITFVCIMNAMIIGVSNYSFAYFVMPWLTEFGIERGTIMLAATLSAAGAVLLSPVAGYWVDRYNVRYLMLGSCLLFMLGLIAIAYAPSFAIVIAIYTLILPIGVVLAGPLMGYALVVRTGVQRMGLAMGIAALGTSLGGFAIPLVVTQLLDGNSWREVFMLLTAGTLVLVFVPALLLVHATPVSASGPTVYENPLAMLRSLPVLQLGIAYLVPALLFISILHNLGALAADLGVAQKEAATITAIASVLMAIAKVAAGMLADRMSHRWLYCSIVGVMAAGIILTSLGTTYPALLVGVALAAIAVGAAAPLVNAIIHARWGAANFGRVIGVVHALAGFSALGSLFAGYVRDLSGGYAVAFLILALGLIPATLCFMALTRAPREPVPQPV